MKAFRPKLSKQIRNDEFQLGKNRSEALRTFRERVDEFDLNQDFVICTNLTMGKYDFERSAFPIKETTKGHYWYEHRYPSGEFPGDIKVYVKNPALMEYVPMRPEAAERFLSARKDSSGNVNRRIFANIRIRICSMKNDEDELLSEIRWAQFFSDNNRTTLVYETPKPPPEASADEEDAKSDEGGTSGDDADG